MTYFSCNFQSINGTPTVRILQNDRFNTLAATYTGVSLISSGASTFQAHIITTPMLTPTITFCRQGRLFEEPFSYYTSV